MSRRKEREPLSREEVTRMRAMARSPLERHLVSILWMTGGRISEILRLRPRDFDFQRRRVRMAILKRKDRDEWRYAVLWDAEATEELSDYCGVVPPDKSLFPLSRQRAYYLVRMVGKKAGIPRAHPHLFRHSLAANWVGNGGSIALVARQLGHINIGTTYAQYGRYQSEDILEEAERVLGSPRRG